MCVAVERREGEREGGRRIERELGCWYRQSDEKESVIVASACRERLKASTEPVTVN